ncbi:MAG: hypothetical protein IPK19_13935 [Chloroflexi bacterium]|nr:hypothetical protein [Chloroflexota bacterium]
MRCLEPLSAADDRPRWSPTGSPVGSPNGSHLAFLSAGGALHIVDASGTDDTTARGVRTLTAGTIATTSAVTAPLPDLIVSAYAWSPAGDRIVAVAADRSSGQGRLVLLGAG